MTNEIDYVFGVSEYTTIHASFEEDLELFKSLEVAAIEVCEVKLKRGEAARDQLESVTAAGLTISSVQPVVHTVFPDKLEPHPQDPQARIDLMRASLLRLGKMVPQGCTFVTNTGAAPGGNIDAALRLTIAAHRELADVASSVGMRLAIEPLNPILMNEYTFIWKIDQALQIIDAVGRDNLGICLDSWNNWQDDPVADHIRSCEDRIFVVQLSDWRTPRAAGDRVAIGDGQIPMPAILRAIRDTGYKGAYSLEIFSDNSLDGSLWKADYGETIRKSKSGLDAAWRMSGIDQA